MKKKKSDLEFWYRSCTLCPRQCGVDRIAGERGLCGEGAEMRVAVAVLHKGEEPPISGEKGSGTIFFSGCALGCSFCQNRQISREAYGRAVSPFGLMDIILRLQDAGARTINMVTADHFAPQVVSALILAREKGLSIPVVWNSSGYLNCSTLDLLADHVDIHLPDLKTLSPELASRLFSAPDYPEIAKRALSRMADSHPLHYRDGKLQGGVIVRHLVLPGSMQESREVLHWYSRNLAGRCLLSLMVQYVDIDTPAESGTLSRRDHEELMELLDELGIEEGFIQDPEDDPAGEAAWIPDFTRRNPFPPSFAQPLWHCRYGFMDG
jgi:putative pyruvate formate lyase activating enzyme